MIAATLSSSDVAMVELLGRADALFWPRRGEFSQDHAAVRACLRMDWRAKGLPARSKAASPTERKLEETLWKALAADGMVRIHGPAGRRTHAKLTFAGEQRARYLTATGDVITCWESFDKLVGLFEACRGQSLPGTSGSGNSLSEALAAGCTPWRRTPEQLRSLTESMLTLLPFLTVGWVRTSSDCGGRVWLGLTREGRAAHTAGCPTDPCPGVGLVEAASDLYDEVFDRFTTELDGMRPRPGTPIVIPIPVGMGWGGYPAEAEA